MDRPTDGPADTYTHLREESYARTMKRRMEGKYANKNGFRRGETDRNIYTVSSLPSTLKRGNSKERGKSCKVSVLWRLES